MYIYFIATCEIRIDLNLMYEKGDLIEIDTDKKESSLFRTNRFASCRGDRKKFYFSSNILLKSTHIKSFLTDKSIVLISKSESRNPIWEKYQRF
jgi:hypothetical protein